MRHREMEQEEALVKGLGVVRILCVCMCSEVNRQRKTKESDEKTIPL